MFSQINGVAIVLNHMLVHFPGDAGLIGSFVPVKITESHVFYLTGTLAGQDA